MRLFDKNFFVAGSEDMKGNLILTGFMGTGKTSLGKLLATRLGRGFIDLDQKIEKDAGMTITEIFEQHGEKYFRELEREAVKDVCTKKNLVIATGGGTVKDQRNIELLKNSGVIVCLTCEPEEIFLRTERRGERPVLDGGGEERLQTIKKLLAERQEFYEQADYTIDTTDWSPLQIMNDICNRFKL